ncbi:MAG: FlgD immunoglobulin-like domain containing protein, partial [Calditrichota bacterium]
CNEFNNDTLWIEQRPYEDSAINALMTHSAPPEFPSCPDQEIPNEKDFFLAGEEAFFAAYYRDHLRDQVTDFEIIQPDSTVFQSWSHSPTRRFRSGSYYMWSYIMPFNAQSGTWTFRATFLGEVYEKTFLVPILTDVQNENDILPERSELQQNYPNPFNPETTIAYRLEKSSKVRLTIFNLLGEEIRSLIRVNQSAGDYQVNWNGRDNTGSIVGSGTYLYRLETDTYSETRQMIFLK